MKIHFLGTGTSQGVPVINCACDVCASADFRDQRLRTSVAIEVAGKVLVIDCGPDFRQQMLRLRPARLDALLITHNHKDHTAGLDDVRPFYFQQGHNIPLYATKSVVEQLKQEYAYAFAADKYPGAPGFNVNPISTDAFEAEGIQITPVEVLHGKQYILGFRIGNFAYITDASYIPATEMVKLKGAEVLVLNALQHKTHHSHFTLKQAIEAAHKIDARQTYFTHISHRLGKHSQINNTLPEGIQLAHDGLTIEVVERLSL